MNISVADLCDGREDQIQVLPPSFVPLGGRRAISGVIRTIKVNQNPKEVRAVLSEPGDNNILVVDAEANPQGAVVGDNLAKIAIDNNWQGIIVNGYIRDTAILKDMAVGIWALGTCPRRGTEVDAAIKDIELVFGGVQFKPGYHLYADNDGIIISETRINEGN